MVTTRLTPSSAASSIESRTSLACRGPTSGLGSRGLPLQLRAVRVTPAELNSPRYCSRASLLARMSSTGRRAGGRDPARVDPGRVQAELAQGLEGIGDRLVVQAGGVGTELHGSVLSSVDGHVGAARLRPGDGRVPRAHGGEPLPAGD